VKERSGRRRGPVDEQGLREMGLRGAAVLEEEPCVLILSPHLSPRGDEGAGGGTALDARDRAGARGRGGACILYALMSASAIMVGNASE